MLKLSDFDYDLPKELIAQYPAEKRDESRLLVLHRDTGRIEHRIFKDIVEYFNPGDLLILNDAKVYPARIVGRKITGGKVEALILDAGYSMLDTRENEHEVLLKPARGCNVGGEIIFGDGILKAKVSKIENGRRFLRFDCNGDFENVLERLGKMPLPPYIKRKPEDSDSIRYQTVYASKKGAVAAPTAGLHFTKELLDKISKKGLDIEYVTLHVGYGTFRPVKSEDIRQHKMEKEYFEIEDRVVKNIGSRRGKIFVVGTTTCRVLETVFSKNNPSAFSPCPEPERSEWFGVQPSAYNGWTDLFIYPGYKFRVVDTLLTNFHLPRTTLLMLVSAFCGRELLFKAYESAIKERYRFYSYGDAMLIV